MVPEIWSMTDNIFCHFVPFFLFTLLPKIKILKKWKQCLDVSSIYKIVPKIMILCYTVPEIWWHDGCNFYFSFWVIFCTFTPLTAQKIKITKKWEKSQDLSSFHTHVPKITNICTVLKIWCMMVGRQTNWWIGRGADGQTDRKSDKWRWVPT